MLTDAEQLAAQSRCACGIDLHSECPCMADGDQTTYRDVPVLYSDRYPVNHLYIRQAGDEWRLQGRQETVKRVVDYVVDRYGFHEMPYPRPIRLTVAMGANHG